MSSSSLLSSNSLRDAFASLDAASLEGQSLSSAASFSAHSSSSVCAPAFLIARQQQSGRSGRVLCGGQSLEEMRSEVQRRAQEQQRRQRDVAVLPRRPSTSTSHTRAAPSFDGFPMSLGQSVEEPGEGLQEQSSSVSNAREEDARAQQRGGSIVTEVITSSTARPDPAPSDEHIEAAVATDTSAATPRKRTMQWAARRDRRIARRRKAPPLTRSQAEQEQAEGVDRPEQNGEPSISAQSGPLPPPIRRVAFSGDTTSDITDPSLGSFIVEISPPPISKEPAKRRQGAVWKKKRTPPLLDLTFTEIAVEDGTSSQQIGTSQNSSETQSDATTSESISMLRRSEPNSSIASQEERSEMIESPPADSSETEEEEGEDYIGDFEQPRSEPATLKNASSTTRPRTSRTVGIARDRDDKKSKASISLRKKAASRQGIPFFEGKTFLLIGFWAKIKLFEGVIAKHAGTVIKEDTVKRQGIMSPSVQYLVACTHSGHRPTAAEIGKWIKSLSKDAQQYAALQTFFRSTPIIQPEWISDCISKCLTKDHLLPIDSYTITTRP